MSLATLGNGTESYLGQATDTAHAPETWIGRDLDGLLFAYGAKPEWVVYEWIPTRWSSRIVPLVDSWFSQCLPGFCQRLDVIGEPIGHD